MYIDEYLGAKAINPNTSQDIDPFNDEKLLNQKLEKLNHYNQSYESETENAEPTFYNESKPLPYQGIWELPQKCHITNAGREIVGQDPNLSPETLKQLIHTERKYLTKAFISTIQNRTKREIAINAFPSAGLAHLSQCIEENFNQTKADLVATYSMDRNIPFVCGAILIDALSSTTKLFYWRRPTITKAGFTKIYWEPTEVYLPPKNKVPPPKKKQYKKYYSPKKMAPYTLADCPHCSNPAIMLRTGHLNKKWHVCCTDPNEQCKMFFGLEPSCETEKQAVEMWNAYAESAGLSSGTLVQPIVAEVQQQEKAACND